MKTFRLIAVVFLLQGCANQSTMPGAPTAQSCLGTTALPAAIADRFEPVSDPTLLNNALGEPDEGGLCQGQVYRSKDNTGISVYRLWNSTNPNSQLGNWWTFERPEGLVSDYRENYEICYQWSPLDKMTRCTLQGGQKIVVGNGQSAKCSDYLSYPASATQQVYIGVAAVAVESCVSYDAELEWTRKPGDE